MLLLGPVAALLAGCAGRGIDAPPLAPRAVERQTVPFPDDASEPRAPLDPALAARIAAIESAATAADRAFRDAHARAAAAVARAAGAAAGSEAWTVAQQELSALDAARGPIGHAAGEIDALRLDPGNATPANRAAVDAAAARVAALAQAQADMVAALSARLRE